MFGKVLSFLFPDPCAICMKPAGRNRFVCASCEEALILLKPRALCRTCLAPLPSGADICGKCLKEKPKYEQLVACALYENELRTSLHRYKFSGRADLHTPFALMLCSQLRSFHCTEFEIVIPVPLSEERLKERGFNQAELIAKEIAKAFHVPCVSDALKKCRNTKRQSDLRGAERSKNIRDAFVLSNSDAVRGKTVLLVDDIFTTGATMREAAAVLSAACKCVYACAVAKTDLEKRRHES